MISVYAHCGNAGAGKSMVYNQHEKIIQEKGLVNTNSTAWFREDLLVVLRRWQEKGDRVVLIMDASEDVIDGVMYKQLPGADL